MFDGLSIRMVQIFAHQTISTRKFQPNVALCTVENIQWEQNEEEKTTTTTTMKTLTR